MARPSPPSLSSRDRWLGLFLVISIALFGGVALFGFESMMIARAKSLALSKAEEFARNVEERFYATTSANYALAAIIRQRGGKTDGFDELAGELLRYHQGVIQNLQLAEGGKVSHIFPLAGSERAIGHDLLADPARRDSAWKAIRSRSLTLAGPVDLVQGGNGMIVRLPVFVRDPVAQGGERFWGFVTSLILTRRFLDSVNLKSLGDQGYLFRLVDNTGATILSDADGDRFADAVSAKVHVPNGVWTLSVTPRAGWVDWPLAIVLSGILFVFLAVVWRFVLAHLREAALQRELAERTEELEELNRTLEERVEQEIAAGRDKELMLIQQGRQAEMGEMIGNIAHQWRQPLNVLGLVVARIRDDFEFGDLSLEKMSAYEDDCRRMIERMSQTIDDFRNFFRPCREKRLFPVRELVREAIRLTSASMKEHEVRVVFHDGEDGQIFGHPNELSQALVILLNNAQQALTQQAVVDGWIDIAVQRDGAWVDISIGDNAGGIADELMDKVFEPYFTTKPNGTGLGLPMARMIVETHLGGAISVRNEGGGAVFLLRLPLSGGLA